MRSLTTTATRSRLALLVIVAALIGAAFTSSAVASPYGPNRGRALVATAANTPRAEQPRSSGSDTDWLAIAGGSLAIVLLVGGGTIFVRRHDAHGGASRRHATPTA